VWQAGGSLGWWGVVEGDAQADVDVPAGDADVLDDQAEQLLELFGVEAVEGGKHLLGEGADALAEPVVGGQRVALGGQCLSLQGGLLLAGVELLGAALQLDQVQQPSLVAVNEAAAFGLGGFGLAVQPGELGGEQLVVGCWGAGGDVALAGQQHLGASNAWRIWSVTKASSESARMLRSGQRRCSPPARSGSWLGQ
jgi:hypothetical protein